MADGAGIRPPASATASSERTGFPADFPEGLKPRLRLFFSVDLAGATRYKQSRNVWRPEILSFYRDFDFILQSEYRAFGDARHDVPAPPEFWKSNGDELLYVCEMDSPDQAHGLMYVWLAALERYRATSVEEAQRLDVKSTAWLGLFPAPNSEIFFRRGAFGPEDQAARDPLIVQSEIRDEWYACQYSTTITREYVGPSMDTGFRLTAWARPSRMIVSVDLAFLLMETQAPGIRPVRLNLSGCGRLKGVVDDQPYPILWLPVGGRAGCDDFAGLPSIGDRRTIRAFCQAIIEQNYSSITPLFLEGGRRGGYDWAPPYILKRILRLWEEEVRHHAEVTHVVLLSD